MSSPEESPWPDEPRTLHKTARTILIGWAALAAGIAIVGVIAGFGVEGWGALIAFIYVVMAGIALVVIGVVALLIRQFAKTPTSQMLAAALVPPLAVVLSIVVLGALG